MSKGNINERKGYDNSYNFVDTDTVFQLPGDSDNEDIEQDNAQSNEMVDNNANLANNRMINMNTLRGMVSEKSSANKRLLSQGDIIESTVQTNSNFPRTSSNQSFVSELSVGDRSTTSITRKRNKRSKTTEDAKTTEDTKTTEDATIASRGSNSNSLISGLTSTTGQNIEANIEIYSNAIINASNQLQQLRNLLKDDNTYEKDIKDFIEFKGRVSFDDSLGDKYDINVYNQIQAGLFLVYILKNTDIQRVINKVINKIPSNYSQDYTDFQASSAQFTLNNFNDIAQSLTQKRKRRDSSTMTTGDKLMRIINNFIGYTKIDVIKNGLNKFITNVETTNYYEGNPFNIITAYNGIRKNQPPEISIVFNKEKLIEENNSMSNNSDNNANTSNIHRKLIYEDLDIDISNNDLNFTLTEDLIDIYENTTLNNNNIDKIFDLSTNGINLINILQEEVENLQKKKSNNNQSVISDVFGIGGNTNSDDLDKDISYNFKQIMKKDKEVDNINNELFDLSDNNQEEYEPDTFYEPDPEVDNEHANYNHIDIYDILLEMGQPNDEKYFTKVEDTQQQVGGEGEQNVMDLTHQECEEILTKTNKNIIEKLKENITEQKLNPINTDGQSTQVKTKATELTKATQDSAVHSISSTIVSEFMNNKENNLDNLIGTNRNKYVLSMFDMISKGYNYNKKKLREDVAAGSNAPRSLKTNNLKQMQQCWGKKVTEHFAYTDEKNGGKGFCYLCGGDITPMGGYSPEVEHKMPCVLFYSQVYNLNHYPVLRKMWIQFIDNNNNGQVFFIMKDLYEAINTAADDSDTNSDTGSDNDDYEKYKKFINSKYDEVYTVFTGYVTDNYKKYNTLIRESNRDKYLNEFKALLKCYLLEFSWSHHTCNQAKTNYNFNKKEELNKYIINLDPIKTGGKPKGAVIKTNFVEHEKNKIVDGFGNNTVKNYTIQYVLPQITLLEDSIKEYAGTINLTNKRLFIRSLKRITLSSIKEGNNENDNQDTKVVKKLVTKEKEFNNKVKELKNAGFGSFIVKHSKKDGGYQDIFEQINNIIEDDVHLLMTLINDIFSYNNLMNVVIGLYLSMPLFGVKLIKTDENPKQSEEQKQPSEEQELSEVPPEVLNQKRSDIFSDSVIGGLSNTQIGILDTIKGKINEIPDGLKNNFDNIKKNYDKTNTDKNTKIVTKFISNMIEIGILRSDDTFLKSTLIDKIKITDDIQFWGITNQNGGKRKRRYKIRKTRKKSKVSKKKTLRFKYKI